MCLWCTSTLCVPRPLCPLCPQTPRPGHRSVCLPYPVVSVGEVPAASPLHSRRPGRPSPLSLPLYCLFTTPEGRRLLRSYPGATRGSRGLDRGSPPHRLTDWLLYCPKFYRTPSTVPSTRPSDCLCVPLSAPGSSRPLFPGLSLSLVVPARPVSPAVSLCPRLTRCPRVPGPAPLPRPLCASRPVHLSLRPDPTRGGMAQKPPGCGELRPSVPPPLSGFTPKEKSQSETRW